MVKIRLMRVGSKKNPHYRVVCLPERTKRETKALEILGFFDPKSKKLELKKERLEYWRKNGAQLTDVVARLLGEKPQRDYSKIKKTQSKKDAPKEDKKEETK